MVSRRIAVWILIVEGLSIQQQRTAEQKEFVIEVDVMPARLPKGLVPGSRSHRIRESEMSRTDNLRLDGVFTTREMPFLLLLLERLPRVFVLQRC